MATKEAIKNQGVRPLTRQEQEQDLISANSPEAQHKFAMDMILSLLGSGLLGKIMGATPGAGLAGGAGKTLTPLGGDMSPSSLLANPATEDATSIAGGMARGPASPVTAHTLSDILGGGLNAGAAGATAGATGLVGTALGGLGQEAMQDDPAQLEAKIGALAKSGVPASQAWQQIFPGEPMNPNLPAVQQWAQMYQSQFGGVDDLLGSGGGTGQAATAQTPTPTPVAGGPGVPTTPAHATVDYHTMSPDEQAKADLEHGVNGATVVPGQVPGQTGPGGPSTIAQQANGATPTAGTPAQPSFDLKNFMYSLLNPQRTTEATLASNNIPAVSPYTSFLKEFMAPAQAQALGGNDIGPDAIKKTYSNYLSGGPVMSAKDLIGKLSQGEETVRQGRASLPGANFSMQDYPTPDAARAAYMAYANQQDPGVIGNLMAETMAGGGRNMGPDMTSILGSYLTSLLNRQVSTGLDKNTPNNRFGYLKSLVGY